MTCRYSEYQVEQRPPSTVPTSGTPNNARNVQRKRLRKTWAGEHMHPDSHARLQITVPVPVIALLAGDDHLH